MSKIVTLFIFFVFVNCAAAATEIQTAQSGFMDRVIAALVSQSGTFLGVVLGSLFTVIGVWMTNRANSARLREQFNHEREKRIEDRRYNVKKEIYLEAIAAIDKGVICVTSSARFTTDIDEAMAEYRSVSSAITKTHLIANPDTLSEVINFTTELAISLFTIYEARIEPEQLRIRADSLSEIISGCEGKRAQALEMMRDVNYKRSTEDGQFEAAESDFKFQQSEIEKYQAQKQQLLDELLNLQFSALGVAHTEQNRIMDYAQKVVVKMRHEIDLLIEQEFYDDILSKNRERVSIAQQKFLAAVQTHNDGTGKNT